MILVVGYCILLSSNRYKFKTVSFNQPTSNEPISIPGNGLLTTLFAITATSAVDIQMKINNKRVWRYRKYSYNSGSTTDCVTAAIPVGVGSTVVFTGLSNNVVVELCTLLQWN